MQNGLVSPSLLFSLSAIELNSLTQKHSDTVRLASWNLLHLRTATPVAIRARVISSFDFVAVQEVMSKEGFQRLLKSVRLISDHNWQGILSSKSGHRRAAEYYGPIFMIISGLPLI
jgi:hypothetical protein